MIIVDANLLIYAVNADAALHREAEKWLEAAFSGTETVGFAWNVVLGFLRVTTKSGMFRRSISVEAAFDLLGDWFSQPTALLVEPGPQHFQILRKLLVPLGTGGNITSDAHLAALAIEHGAQLCSADSDFARFGGLRWHNPLAR
jgi:uncharacterized protein